MPDLISIILSIVEFVADLAKSLKERTHER
jgi:hypothetical protein